jgi:hypothetical protein
VTRGHRPDYLILDEMMTPMADFTAAMHKLNAELAKFGEVFVRFDTAPLLRDPSSEFDDDIAQMRAAER